ncbi:MAG: HlyD family secretion protein [Pseudomonadota bacterium]|nr:HlyD family secretion protein [Pseudomonadota bacterium]
MSLFRRETEEARANAWLGRILLTRPLSFTVLTAAGLAMVVAIGAYFVAGEYTRKARVTGVLAPVHGIVKIVAQQAGVVQQVFVQEGSSVAREDAVLIIADGRIADARQDIGSAIAIRLSERKQALVSQREHALAALRSEQALISRRRAALDRELLLLEGELASQGQRARLAHQSLDRALHLERTGFVSSAAVDRERDAALDHESRVAATRRARIGLAREADGTELEAQSAYSRAHAQIAAIDMQLASLAQERVERDLQYRTTIAAPSAGSVAAVLVEPGQAIMPGTIVATLIPTDSRLEAHLFAPSRSIGFVRAGQEVLLRFLAYPHQKFGSHVARVVAVTRSAMSPTDLGFVPADGSREPLYRIKVELSAQSISAYGREEPLQAGMQVEADIRLDRRRLIEWIFEPLLSLAGRA